MVPIKAEAIKRAREQEERLGFDAGAATAGGYTKAEHNALNARIQAAYAHEHPEDVETQDILKAIAPVIPIDYRPGEPNYRP